MVHAGPGLDLVLGGSGQDFIILGTDAGSEVFAGEGNDFILGNKNAERILGNEGDDWLETGTFDGAPGDNFDEIFARDGIDGNDVFLGDGGFDEFIGEGGDDIMVGSPGRGKMAGMSGFDWATYKDNDHAVNADLSIPIVFDENPTLPQNAALDQFESIEGLSGSRFNDTLRGSNVLADERVPALLGGTEGFAGSALDAEGIALISGLQDVLGAGVTSYSAGDIILGGDGSDVIIGQAGDDIIDGDKWLDVQIGVFAPGDTNHTGEPIALHNSMKTLTTAMFSGAINPAQLGIVRTIRTDTSTGDTDIAAFSDLRANYDITPNPDGTVTVVHARGTQTDGTDTLRNIERLHFADDGPVAVNDFATVAEGFSVTTVNVLDNDFDPDTPLTAANITAFSQGANGSVVNNGNGTFTYVHNGTETISDSFTYTIDDLEGGTDTATVNVTVNPVNDAPVARNDAATVAEGGSVTTVNVLDNDSDPDSPLTATSIIAFSQGTNGTVVDNGDGTFTYTHDGSETTSDSFAYTIDDGAGGTATATVDVTVSPVMDGFTYVYDALNRLDYVSVHNQDGTSAITDYDQANANPWAYFTYGFDAQNRVDYSATQNDDGTYVATDYDQANANPWAYYTYGFDAQNRVDYSNTQNDDGSHVVTDYDQANANPWTYYTYGFDAQNRVDYSNTQNDDGSHVGTDYDQANENPWEYVSNSYDAQNNLIHTHVLNDDGSTLII